MKIIIILSTAVCAIISSPALERRNQKISSIEASPIVNLTGVPQYTAVDSDVKIYYHSRSTSTWGVLVDVSDATAVAQAGFSKKKKTIVVIHGWLNTHNTEINLDIRNAYLKMHDVNVFIVDWSKIALLDYITAQFNVKSIGEIVGERLGLLVSNSGLTLAGTVLIGHSLGAHIAGVAGKKVNGQADYVIGLDPAGPLFTTIVTDNRIETTSGKFVQIMHTNAGILGMNAELGHADYWVNGGTEQAGCLLDVTGICSHNRAFKYLAESIETGNFKARACSDWITYESGQCTNEQSSWMGQDNIDKTASGKFFLATNSASPYAKG